MIYDFYHNTTWVDSCPAEQASMLTAVLTALYGDIRMVARGVQAEEKAFDFWEWMETI